MEPQKSTTMIPFPSSLTVVPSSSTASNPLLVSLQQLQGLNVPSFNSTTMPFGDLQSHWHRPMTMTMTNTWLDQANKVASLLPVYPTASLQQSSSTSSKTSASSISKLISPTIPTGPGPGPGPCPSSSSSSSTSAISSSRLFSACAPSTSSSEHNAMQPCDYAHHFSLVHQQQQQQQQQQQVQNNNLLDSTALDDLAANWPRDFDLSDFNLSAELFGTSNVTGGTAMMDGRDGVHSVLEYDPNTLLYAVDEHRHHENRTTTITPPPSSTSMTGGAASSMVVTPKMREKIKIKREKELADADKEFERLLSLVAKKDNAGGTATRRAPLPLPLPLALHLVDTSDKAQCSSSSILTDRLENDLSPVQFTPPDSPTTTTTIRAMSPQPESPVLLNLSMNPVNPVNPVNTPKSPPLPAVFIPRVEKTNRSTKVPIYKLLNESKKPPQEQSSAKQEGIAPTEDAYSFIDDDENKPVIAGNEQFVEQNLEVEVARRISRINSAHPSDHQRQSGNGQTKNVPYVPGINTAQPDQDLWRHVVPKKRQTNAVLERPPVPSTPLLPPAAECHRPLSPVMVSPEIITLVDTIRKRRWKYIDKILFQYRERRQALSFVRTERLEDTATVIAPREEPSVTLKQEADDGERGESRILPKVIIRIPKRCILEEETSMFYTEEKRKKKAKKKKKKRRKRKERDREWEGSDRLKQEHKKKHKHHRNRKCTRRSPDEEYESGAVCTLDGDIVDDDDNGDPVMANDEKPSVTMPFSRKRRLMMQWNEGEGEDDCEQVCGDDSGRVDDDDERPRKQSSRALLSSEENIENRVHRFSLPSGPLQKGIFVVCKQDLLKSDCPLWRVDNQNLLQKFPAKEDGTGRVVFKNSSTYSGWCDRLADNYLIVHVRFLKHSRSETVVQPDAPLSELFPAISCEMAPTCSDSEHGTGQGQGGLSPHEFDIGSIPPLQAAVETLILALLHHVVSGTFLNQIKLGNDWKFLRHMNDIDRLVGEHKTKLLIRVKWGEKFEDAVKCYSMCSVGDADSHGFMCQACGGRTVEKVVQLFANEGYDYDNLESVELKCSGSGSPIPAVEYLVCPSCATLTAIYHKLHHMRYHLYKKCEDHLETVCDDNADIVDEDGVVALCLKNRMWMRKLAQDYLDLWKKLDDSDTMTHF